MVMVPQIEFLRNYAYYSKEYKLCSWTNLNLPSKLSAMMAPNSGVAKHNTMKEW